MPLQELNKSSFESNYIEECVDVVAIFMQKFMQL